MASAWLPESWDELYPLIEKRFSEIARLFAGRIPVFDCVNEPERVWDVHHNNLDGKWKHVVPPEDYCEKIFALARRYFNDNQLILNEAVVTSFTEFHGRYGAYYLMLKDLLSRGVEIDKIGLQCHTNDSPDFQNVYNAARAI